MRLAADNALVVELAQRTPMPVSGAFSCAAGELLALVGPSGAGKTSVLRMLAGLMRPQAGRVLLGPELWSDSAQGVFLPAPQRRVGLVFQNYALMPHLTARDNVALALLHLPAGQRASQAGHWLDHVGLPVAQQGRLPRHLSGGEQQRVAVARALARAPRLLLLDEPFSAVDQMSRQALYQLLADMRQELHIPIILVTHDLNEARLLADRFVVMDGGRVLQQGAPATIYRSPRNARVADLVGIRNRFLGVWLGPAADNGWGMLQWGQGVGKPAAGPTLMVPDKGRLRIGQNVHWVITGDAITLVDAAASTSDDLPAKVTQVRQLGEISLATLGLVDFAETQLQLTLSGPQRGHAVVGERLALRLDRSLVHVMPSREP